MHIEERGSQISVTFQSQSDIKKISQIEFITLKLLFVMLDSTCVQHFLFNSTFRQLMGT